MLSPLREVRAFTDEAWAEVYDYNSKHALADSERIDVTFYFGQNIDDPTFIPPAEPS